MNFKQIMMVKAIEAVDQITDPEAKAYAIAELLKSPDADTEIDVEAKVAPKTEEAKPVKAAKASKAKKAEAKVEEPKAVEKTPETADTAPKAAEPAPQPAVETAPEPVTDVAEKAPAIEAPAPEAVAKIKEAVENVEPYMPKDKETSEERQERQAVLVKALGDMKLSEILSDENKKCYLKAELKALGVFRTFMLKKFGITIDENGVEHNEGKYNIQFVNDVIHHYIHECDETCEKWEDIKLDKFISIFIPYMMNLYALFSSYTDMQIIEAGRKMIHNDNFSLGRINYKNISAILYLLNPEAKMG